MYLYLSLSLSVYMCGRELWSAPSGDIYRFVVALFGLVLAFVFVLVSVSRVRMYICLCLCLCVGGSCGLLRLGIYPGPSCGSVAHIRLVAALIRSGKK